MLASATAVLVGLLGLHTSTRRVATVISRSIAGRSWRSFASRATVMARAPGGAGGGGEGRVDGERRPRVDELGSGLEQRLAGGEQDVAGAVADGYARGGDAVAVRQALAQQRVGRVGVAVERSELTRDRLAHGVQRWERRLVAGEQHERVLLRVAACDGVGGDAPYSLRELDRHRLIVPRSGPCAARGHRRGRRGWARGPRRGSNGSGP